MDWKKKQVLRKRNNAKDRNGKGRKCKNSRLTYGTSAMDFEIDSGIETDIRTEDKDRQRYWGRMERLK